MRPSDVIATRRILIDQARDVMRNAPPDPDPDKDYDDVEELVAALNAKQMADDTLWILSDSPGAYLVTDDMTVLATAAALSMPDEPLRHDDLPEDSGIVLFDRSIGTVQFSDFAANVFGAIWRWTPVIAETVDGEEFRQEDVTIVLLASRSALPVNLFPLERMMWIAASDRPHEYLPDRASTLGSQYDYSDEDMVPRPTPRWRGRTPSDEEPSPMIEAAGSIGAALRATWVLMQQTLTVSEPMHADRAESRRSARAGLPSDLVIVHLRKHRHEALEDPEGESGAEWSHRWLVSGHWRNQWLPSRACHRLQWIDAHVKGPEDKPLVLKEKVHVWSR